MMVRRAIALALAAQLAPLDRTPTRIPAMAAPPSLELKSSFESLPLYFTENRGQTDDRVAYYVTGRDLGVFFTSEGVTYALSEPSAQGSREHRRWAVKLEFLDAREQVKPVGSDITPAVVSYFQGSEENWKTGIPTYASVVYRELWPGIRLGVDATRSAIEGAFDRGASVVSYLGHGGIHLWAHEDIFNGSQVASLGSQVEQPLVLTLNCLNGYFHFPYFNSLAEELVKARGKGAIAAFSPSGLSLDDAAHVFHKLLLEELASGKHQRLGDAVLAAQSAYADSGALPELLSIYHLLGDPALQLR